MTKTYVKWRELDRHTSKSHLVQQLVAARGNNVTIFDSCNSGSIGRKKQMNSRLFESTQPIPTASMYGGPIYREPRSSSSTLFPTSSTSTLAEYVLQDPERGSKFCSSDGICATRLTIGYGPGRDYLRPEDIIEELGAIPGIPDYLAHSLLQQVAFEMVRTAIFDLCNSGGIGRKKQNGRFFRVNLADLDYGGPLYREPRSRSLSLFPTSSTSTLAETPKVNACSTHLMGYARRDFPSDTALVGTRSNSTFLKKDSGYRLPPGLRIDQAPGHWHGLDRATFKPDFVSSSRLGVSRKTAEKGQTWDAFHAVITMEII
ncbi:hypothetical protein B0H13DRAFT_2284202 [Mycena leptocephala]|nr:hypothetical protein B0H13DRAFT_2284202 [Mycena leptocephala]